MHVGKKLAILTTAAITLFAAKSSFSAKSENYFLNQRGPRFEAIKDTIKAKTYEELTIEIDDWLAKNGAFLQGRSTDTVKQNGENLPPVVIRQEPPVLKKEKDAPDTTAKKEEKITLPEIVKKEPLPENNIPPVIIKEEKKRDNSGGRDSLEAVYASLIDRIWMVNGASLKQLERFETLIALIEKTAPEVGFKTDDRLPEFKRRMAERRKELQSQNDVKKEQVLTKEEKKDEIKPESREQPPEIKKIDSKKVETKQPEIKKDEKLPEVKKEEKTEQEEKLTIKKKTSENKEPKVPEVKEEKKEEIKVNEEPPKENIKIENKEENSEQPPNESNGEETLRIKKK